MCVLTHFGQICLLPVHWEYHHPMQGVPLSVLSVKQRQHPLPTEMCAAVWYMSLFGVHWCGDRCITVMGCRWRRHRNDNAVRLQQHTRGCKSCKPWGQVCTLGVVRSHSKSDISTLGNNMRTSTTEESSPNSPDNNSNTQKKRKYIREIGTNFITAIPWPLTVDPEATFKLHKKRKKKKEELNMANPCKANNAIYIYIIYVCGLIITQQLDPPQGY